MACETAVGLSKGKPKLCGEPATSYMIRRGSNSTLIVTQELCPRHADKARREGYLLDTLQNIVSTVQAENRSPICRS